jgi:hypothetical protein
VFFPFVLDLVFFSQIWCCLKTVLFLKKIVRLKNNHEYKINNLLLKFTQVIGKLLKSPTSSYKCSKKNYVQRIICNISNIKTNAIFSIDANL